MRSDLRAVERAAGRHPVIFGTSYAYQTTLALWRLRLHVFWKGDPGEAFHDHPWPFATFPLHAYVEQVLDTETGVVLVRVVPARKVSRRPAEHCHRVLGRWAGRGIEIAPGPVVTFVWRGKHERPWSYWLRRDGGAHRLSDPLAYLRRVEGRPREEA